MADTLFIKDYLYCCILIIMITVPLWILTMTQVDVYRYGDKPFPLGPKELCGGSVCFHVCNHTAPSVCLHLVEADVQRCVAQASHETNS